MTSRVAITGGAGFIGSNLARRISPIYNDLVIIDDLSTGLKSNLKFNENLVFREISVCDKKDL